jgi:anti-sigma regulatory factor (Ser/Thr protein kinase)
VNRIYQPRIDRHNRPPSAFKQHTVSEHQANHLLPPDLDSVVLVRRAVEAMGLQPLRTGAVKLVVSELVTNSIEHARLGPDDQIQVLASLDRRGALHMEVRDAGPGPSADAVRGMGWCVVERVADRWGFDRCDGLSRVWFELD